MLSIGHLHIRGEELSSLSFNGEAFALQFQWPEADVPVLLAIPTQTAICFDHLVPWGDPLPVRLTGWRCTPGRRGMASIAVEFQIGGAIALDTDRGG